DYGYAGRLYQLVMPRITAKRVIIFGVFHKARVFECRDRLVFDDFRTWRGPFGAIPVSDLRAAIIQQLDSTDYIISNDMHTVEHSVEAVVPWLQAYNPDVEIVPVLVPYMEWPTLQTLSDRLSAALADICRRNGWEPGRDLAVVVSCDAVHYGDEGWGDSNYAAFGTDVLGYQQAVQRDRNIAEQLLSGPITPDKLHDFLYTCVAERDVTHYQVTWCGRFSVPLGLDVARRLVRLLADRPLTGYLLDYGTSVSESTLDLSAAEGMGFTAPNNFHHFVGYAAMGYR
ncbi:MAG: AmmeMemoRadiSam system protein B, partial [Acidobacteria bacterium]|nr:AmmeMemoRadiSam system protein B [Acidobacteriota bacterium]